MANVAEAVQIETIKLTSDRFQDEKSIDLLSVTLEVSIHENILFPFVTGNITFFDNSDIFGVAELQGTERLEFTYKSILMDNSVTKNFVITSYTSQKNNDNSAVLVCTLMEDIGFMNEINVISKAYTGFGEDIIRKIVLDNFDSYIRDYSRSDQDIETGNPKSVQGEFKYLTPFITPFTAISNVLGKITTTDGLPFFCYKPINSDRIVLKDFETILTEGPFNKEQPLIYSQDITNSRNQQGSDIFRSLNKFIESPMNENTLALVNSGAVGSRAYIINMTTGEEPPAYNVDVTSIIQQLIDRRVTDQPLPLVDLSFVPNKNIPELKINNYSSVLTAVATSEVFPSSGKLALGEENQQYQHLLKAVSSGIMKLLKKNMFTVSGPGAIMSDDNIRNSVGNTVEINILNNDMVGSTTVPRVDHKRSGTFVIIGKQLWFDVQDDRHSYSLSVSRITNKAGVV